MKLPDVNGLVFAVNENATEHEKASTWLESAFNAAESVGFAWVARLLVAAGTAGNLTTDAHLAALAIEHRATLGSFDRDFERFSGLRLEVLG